MSDPDRWLADQLAGAPESLRKRIWAAWGRERAEVAEVADGAGGAGVAERLRGVAERLMEEAKAGKPDRETAMTLLAADALITLACEWTAEHDPERLGILR
jgi:hypothetical protein